jgi:hypothetical protein
MGNNVKGDIVVGGWRGSGGKTVLREGVFM